MQICIGGNKALGLLILACFFFLNSEAQTLSGFVVDKVGGQAVPYAIIVEQNSQNTYQTDRKGHFSIKFGKHTQLKLHFSHTSYEDFDLVCNKARQDTLINISLSEKINTLDEFQIQAIATRQVLGQSYSQTNLDNVFIEEKIAASLIDVLEQAPGITKRSEYHSPIVLRGLGGKRLLVTKDGNRRMGSFSGGFMGQGVNIYDLAKVEIIKGPASVMYGPGAITGIINMESKYPFLNPGWHGKLQSSYADNNKEKMLIAALNWANMDNAFSISGRFREADDYIAGKQTPTQNSAYKDKDLRASYTYENNSALMITAESELHLGGSWGRPVGFNGTQYMRLYNTHDDIWHSALTAVWKPEQRLKKLELSLYYDQEYRRQYKDSYDIGSGNLSYREDIAYRNYYAGWRALSAIGWHKNTLLNIGSDGVFYRIESPTTLTDYFLNTEIHNRVSQDAGVFLGGLFAEAEHRRYHNRLKFRCGLRVDYSRINEGEVHDTLQASGRMGDVYSWNATAGVVYSLKPDLNVSFQLARSSRMPDAAEMFIETSNTDGIIYGNPKLKPEYGLNLDAGLRGKLGDCSFDLSLFSNFLHDFISLEYWKNSGKKGINYTYLNIEKARIAGGELSLEYNLKNVFSPKNKLTYNSTYVFTIGDKLTDAPDWFSQGVPLRNIPPFNTTQELSLRRMFNSAHSAYIGFDTRYYATQNRIAPSADGGYISYTYTLFGASAGYSYKEHGCKWELKLKADNLADNRYRAFESLSYSMGRNFKLMGSLSF